MMLRRAREGKFVITQVCVHVCFSICLCVVVVYTQINICTQRPGVSIRYLPQLISTLLIDKISLIDPGPDRIG